MPFSSDPACLAEKRWPRFIRAAGILAIAVCANTFALAGPQGDALVVRPTDDFSKPERFEASSAGALTSRHRVNGDAFSHASSNMSFERELMFKLGNGFFRRLWISSPASTQAADGLGPLYNARSCQRCHLKDGRGHPPHSNAMADPAISMFLRLSIPPQGIADRAALAEGRLAAIPEPIYGGQLQNFAIQGHRAEGRLQIDYEEIEVPLSGGERAWLRKPSYRVTDLGYGPMHAKTMMSARVAPQMIGLGLLAAISDDQLRSQADPRDRDGNGVSGRLNWVWSRKLGRMAIGRFGWKAGNATIEDQTTGAFSGDMGLSTPARPDGAGECTDRQITCKRAPDGNSRQYENVEVHQDIVDLTVFYARNLAVPARRDPGDQSVLAGKRLFYDFGCIACHRPKFITQTDPPGLPEQSRQLIWPYTDLLLHDMGDGLADGRPEGRASGREWRTPPLWGIGLTKTVSGHTYFLHDGRARNLLEAILWHGGEGESAKRAVTGMAPLERRNLIRFLQSL